MVNDSAGRQLRILLNPSKCFNELLTGVREDIAVKLFGEDLQVLAAKNRAVRIAASVEGGRICG